MMNMILRCIQLIALYCVTLPAYAEIARPTYPAPPPPAVTSGSILQIIFSLLLVLAVIALVAWLLKRMNVTRQGSGNMLKVLGSVAIGQRERIVLIEVEDTWLVVGVGPAQIRTLHTLAKSTLPDEQTSNLAPVIPFNTWLKKFIEKRDAT